MPNETRPGYEHSPETRPSLEQQFENAEYLDLDGNKIKVVDISPEVRKTEIPTIYLPGFTATPAALKDAILRTAEAGRRVISAYAPHGLPIRPEEPALEGAELPEAQLRKLKSLLELIQAKALNKVNIIAHSEAAPVALAAADLASEKFSDLVLVEPAGLIGHETPFKVSARAFKEIFQGEKIGKKMELKKAQYSAPISIGIKSILSDIPATIKEIQALAVSDITRILKQVRQQGVRVSIIHAVDDKPFPMNRVQETVKADMVDGFYSVKGTHNMIYSYEPFGRVAEEILSEQEALRGKLEKKLKEKLAEEAAKAGGVEHREAVNEPKDKA